MILIIINIKLNIRFFRSNIDVAFSHFKNSNILDSCIIKNVHELFINVILKYSQQLEISIENLKKRKILKPKPRKNFYNYLLVDAELLYKLIDSFDINGLTMRSIDIEDLKKFLRCIIYIGKGKNDRRHKHLLEGKKCFDGKMELSKITSKLSKIKDIWKRGGGIVVLQLFSDSDHYLSLCRENAMIRAAGNSLTNIINGSIFGLMKSQWSDHEINNFGEMLLYFALKQSIFERPTPIFASDLKNSKPISVFEPKKYFIKTNYELNGILDYFLDL